MLDHSGVENKVELWFSRFNDVSLNELNTELLFFEKVPGVGQGILRKIHQADFVPARSGQFQALPASATSRLEDSAAGRKKLRYTRKEFGVKPLYPFVPFSYWQGSVVSVPFLSCH